MKTSSVIKKVTTEFLYEFLKEEFNKIDKRINRLEQSQGDIRDDIKSVNQRIEHSQDNLRDDIKSVNQRIDQIQNTLMTMQNTLLQSVQILIDKK